MSNAVTVNIKGLDELERKLGPQLVAGPARRFLTKWGIAVAAQAAVRSPRNKGQLAGSMTHEINGSYPSISARAGTNADHAPFMEGGTGLLNDGSVGGGGSRHWPPGNALDGWARTHGFDNGGEVAAAIGRRGGLKPRKMLRNAVDDTVGKVPGYVAAFARDIEASAGEK